MEDPRSHGGAAGTPGGHHGAERQLRPGDAGREAQRRTVEDELEGEDVTQAGQQLEHDGQDDPAPVDVAQTVADVAEPGHRHENPGGEDCEHDGGDDALAKLPRARCGLGLDGPPDFRHDTPTSAVVLGGVGNEGAGGRDRPAGTGHGQARERRKAARGRGDDEGEGEALFGRQRVPDDGAGDDACADLAADRSTQRAHDGVHACRHARLLWADGLDDEVGERGEGQADADAEDGRTRRRPPIGGRGRRPGR